MCMDKAKAVEVLLAKDPIGRDQTLGVWCQWCDASAGARRSVLHRADCPWALAKAASLAGVPSVESMAHLLAGGPRYLWYETCAFCEHKEYAVSVAGRPGAHALERRHDVDCPVLALARSEGV